MPTGFYPIRIGRGISLAWHLFRFGWRTFVAISLIAALPVVLIEAVSAYVTFGPISDWQLSVSGSPLVPPVDAHTVLATFPAWAFGVLLLSVFVSGPFTTIGGAALLDAIATAIRGGSLSTRASYRAAFRRLWPLLGLYFVLTVGGVGGAFIGSLTPLLGVASSALGITAGPAALLALIVFVGFVFAFVFVAIRIAFTIQALMIENLTAMGALRRSWSLLAGSMLRYVGWLLAFAFVVGLVGIVFEIAGFVIALIISPPRLSTIATFTTTFGPTFSVVLTLVVGLGSAILQPIVAIGMTLLYFEIRWRRGDAVPVPGQPTPTADPAAAA